MANKFVGILHALDEPHYFQYPKISFNQIAIKPSPTICLLDSDNQIKTSNLIAVAVPVVEGQASNSNVFSQENAPGVVNNGAIRLESSVECINFDLSREFSRRGKRTFVFSFNNLKPILRLPANAPLQDVVIQLGFTVFNLDTFPPTVINQILVPQTIKVMATMTGWEAFKQYNFEGQNSIFLTAKHAPEKPMDTETHSLPSNINTPPQVPAIASPQPTPQPQPPPQPTSQPNTPESNPQSPPPSPQHVSSPPPSAPLLTVDIKVKNDTDAPSSSLGQIQVPKGTRLDELRVMLLRDNEKFHLSSTFSFYFEKMASLVESHQESTLKVDLFGPAVHIIMPKTHSPRSPESSLEMKENNTKPNSAPPQMKDTSQTNNGGLNSSGNHAVGSKSQTPSAEEWLRLNDKARLWWLQKYNDMNVPIALDDFISDIEESFDSQSPEAEPQLIHIGLNDFFGNVCKSGFVKLSDLLLFLRFYGPIDTFKNRVYQVYKEKFFHGFISLEESETLLRGCLGSFLVRYSQSLLEKGCFVLNVNKGTKKKDVIESYIIRYDITTESFIFYNKTYKSLREFSKESLYHNVLKDGLSPGSTPVQNPSKVFLKPKMSKRKFLEAQRAHDDFDDESAVDALLKEIAQNEKESKENSKSTSATGEKIINKQRVLMLCSRGTPARYRHLMKDVTAIIPHSKRESKMDKKDNTAVINELSQMRSCTTAVYFETKKKMDCYMWIARTPTGPSARFHLSNIHTLGELKMIGNCLKGSRPILSFDKNFEEAPHWMLVKELLCQVFNTPRGHPSSKPFVDHVLSFFVLDGRIWVRHYQIAESEKKLSEPELIEIGPRFVMNPIKIFSGSFQGAVLYHNPDFVSPNEIRRMHKLQKDTQSVKDHFVSKDKQEKKQKIKASVPHGPNLDQVFE